MDRQTQVEAFGRKYRTGLVTLLFTDMVGSTALKQRLGDKLASDFFRAHDSLVRETLKQFSRGKEIEKAGDSFLLVFATPSDAVQFSVFLQTRLKGLPELQDGKGLDRIGIHVGEVVLGAGTQARPSGNLFGIQIDTCSRVMSLARAGQILMTRGAFDSARQVLKGEDIEGVGPLTWLNHGPYLLKGLEDPVEICEVGPNTNEVREPPSSSDKAQRQVRADEEHVLGWRPAVGQLVPNTRWSLEQKLGEGAFGEVWLGQHQTMKERRVFKFCFRADRVRSLKREMTLFRLLKERIGHHPHIVRLLEVYFDQPPFYLEMDYVAGHDLKGWCDVQGGVAQVPLETKLEIVAQAADGLQAAHDAGVIHRDIKPGNILVSGSVPGQTSVEQPGTKLAGEAGPLSVRLSDFGIGQVVSEEYLAGMTRAGFTQTLIGSESSSQTGTQMYMAPELAAGKIASTRSDIYSLGVVLYQLLLNDFTAPVTTDWWKNVSDPLLRDDLEHCFAGRPPDRFAAAGLLAKQLRSIPARRSARQREEMERRERERRAYRLGVMRTAGLAAIILIVVAVLAVIAWRQSKRAQDTAAVALAASRRAEIGEKEARRFLYVANMNLAQQKWEEGDMGRLDALLNQCSDYPGRSFEYYYWQRQIHSELRTFRGHLDAVKAVAFFPDGSKLVTGSADRSVAIWEVDTGRELSRLTGHSAPILCVAVSPDGRLIATGSFDMTAKIWDAHTGKEKLTLRRHIERVAALAFSPDSRRLATVSWDDKALLWDTNDGSFLAQIDGGKPLNAVAFAPDGRTIATGSQDFTKSRATVWDLDTGRELASLSGFNAGIWQVTFSPDGKSLAIGSGDQTARLWQIGSPEAKFEWNAQAAVNGVSFSPDGDRVVACTGGRQQKMIMWDARNGRELMSIKGHWAQVSAVVFSPTGRVFATGSDDGTAKLWPADSPHQDLELIKHSNLVHVVEFSLDGKRILTASSDGTAKLWDAAQGKELRTFRAPSGPIQWAALAPEGERVALASARQVDIIEVATDKTLALQEQHRSKVTAVAWSPDGQRLVTCSADESAATWDARTGRKLAETAASFAPLRCVAWSPDGQRIVLGGEDSTALVWEPATGRIVFRFKHPAAPINAVAYSGNARLIATACDNGTVSLWSAETGKRIAVLSGHTAAVAALAFSRNSQRIATASPDYTAKLWDTATGRELLTLRTSGHPIYAVAFSPDNQQILTGGYTGISRLWRAASQMQVDGWTAEAKAATNRLASLEKELEVARAQARVARRQEPGAIRHWLILAPIPFTENEKPVEALRNFQLPAENELKPRDGDQVLVNSLPLTWKAMELEDYQIDFQAILGRGAPRSVAYAVTYLQNGPTPRKLKLLVGSDDQAKVYLNGREVYAYSFGRQFVPDYDTVENGIELKPGLNVLVFKVVNINFAWRGSIRFVETNGAPATALQARVTP